jgi:hypothetical protein
VSPLEHLSTHTGNAGLGDGSSIHSTHTHTHMLWHAHVLHRQGGVDRRNAPGMLKPGGGGQKFLILTSSGSKCNDAATCSTMFSMMRMPGKSPGPLCAYELCAYESVSNKCKSHKAARISNAAMCGITGHAAVQRTTAKCMVAT